MPIAHVKLNNNYQLSASLCLRIVRIYWGTFQTSCSVSALYLQMIIYYQCPLWLWLPCVRVTPARFCTVATFSSDFPIGRLAWLAGWQCGSKVGVTTEIDQGERADWLLIYHPCSQRRSSCRGQEGSLLEHNRTEMESLSREGNKSLHKQVTGRNKLLKMGCWSPLAPWVTDLWQCAMQNADCNISVLRWMTKGAFLYKQLSAEINRKHNRTT